MEQLPLSVALITLNAAHQLEPCLQSVRFAADIVVVDSGSQDGTTELARRYGARVIEQPWLGFGPQKQAAVAAAQYDWVLCLDADERVTPELAQAIAQTLRQPQHLAYRMPRRNRFLGRWLRHGEGYPDWCLRLFDRRHARWSDDAVHEKVLANGPVGTLRGDLLHESAEDLSDYINKQNRYSSILAERAWAAGQRARPSQLLFSPLARFIKFYLLRSGFRDGAAGFVHIAIGCWASFLKYAKLLAQEQQRKQP